MIFDIPKNSKIAVGLSGGVDSSVSAFLLKQQGFDIVGVHMQCWDYDAKACTGKQDRADAVSVASMLDIPFLSLDFQKEYNEKVMSYFYDEYKNGRTPNPDILCNTEIKFGLFLEWALANGFDYVSTGHYVKKIFDEVAGLYKLRVPLDKSKDQSYFLYRLNQNQLSKAIFPLGDILKTDVRKIAEEHNFLVANKPDSVGICFIGNVDIKSFLIKQNPEFREKKGEVLNTSGEVIGEHDGAVFFTIGQRHGFTVTKYQGVPMYVLKKDIVSNKIVVGTYEECMNDTFEITNLHWQGHIFLLDAYSLTCKARIRHLGKLYDAQIESVNSIGYKGSNAIQVKLSEKAFGIAPGQSVVFYDDAQVLGGAIIK